MPVRAGKGAVFARELRSRPQAKQGFKSAGPDSAKYLFRIRPNRLTNGSLILLEPAGFR
jgi:hypothetical protein